MRITHTSPTKFDFFGQVCMATTNMHGRISSDINVLNELNKNYPWIPNERTLRPSAAVLDSKRRVMAEVESQWMSIRDYIYHDVYHLPALTCMHTGRKYVDDAVLPHDTWAFVPSKFPYDLSADAHHYVLWDSSVPYTYEYDDAIVNMKIITMIHRNLGHDHFEFAWYKNPKPTVPHVWHVQVFWKNTH